MQQFPQRRARCLTISSAWSDSKRSSTEPTASLVMIARPSTSAPISTAAMVSRAIDRPTTSAPAWRSSASSAGVWSWGPTVETYTPSASDGSTSWMISRSRWL
ncbi:hypothetical protein BJF83_05080 [Nocardiopsis sp. CNR-923]|nr:hypothetical protein BJF83_05080 [Nocardiopsis sp. CNR-923]